MKNLTFKSIKLETIDKNSEIWISSKSLASALGYKSNNAITDLYNANKVEFTDKMASFGELPNRNKTKTRIFSLRGAHLIAMLSRTPVAKEFRKWVLDLLDKEADELAGEENSLSKPKILSFSFHGTKIKVAIDENDIPYFSVSNICRNLGLDISDYQRKRVQMDAVLSGYVRKFSFPSGRGVQKTLFLPLKRLNYFLNTINLPKKHDFAGEKYKILSLYKRESVNFIYKSLDGLILAVDKAVESDDSNITKVEFRRKVQAFSDKLIKQARLDSKNYPNERDKKEEIIKALSYLLSINEIYEIFEKYDNNYDYILHNLYAIMNYFKHSLKMGNPKVIIEAGLEMDVAFQFRKNDNKDSN